VDGRLSYLSRIASGVAVTAALLAVVGLRVTSCAPAPKLPPQALTPNPAALACRAPGWELAADLNSRSLEKLTWSPFGRGEVGWRIYAPLIGREIGARCPPQSPAFARELAVWQESQGFVPDGLLSELTFIRLKSVVQSRRPFVLLAAVGVCPSPPKENSLVVANFGEGLGGKVVELRPGALAAYRRMVAAARAEESALAADPDLLKIFSGYRSPDYDAARCAAEQNCNGRERAACSPHRTGLAMDLYLGHAQGYTADSSADANRLYMAEGPAYRWLLANADRFGFVNYPFEPWHWEWTGEAPKFGARVAAAGASAAGIPGRSTRSAGP
jgi:hypothetical protein